MYGTTTTTTTTATSTSSVTTSSKMMSSTTSTSSSTTTQQQQLQMMEEKSKTTKKKDDVLGGGGGGWTTTTMMMVRSVIHTAILLVPFFSILILIVGGFSSSSSSSSSKKKNINKIDNRNIDSKFIYEMSGFDTNLYVSMTEEPYISYPCMPRKIHLSQASNVDPITNQISMTISFTINRSFTTTSGDSSDENGSGSGGTSCDTVRPRIVYGEKNWFSSILLPIDGGLLTPSTNTITLGNMEKIDFTYNSPKTKEHYVSDYIYHATITNVTAGLKEYWYRIIVDDNEYEYEERRNSNNIENHGIVNNQRSSSSVSSVRQRRTLSLRGSKRLVGETPTYTFLTPPLSGGGKGNNNNNSPTNIALVGDIGQTVNSSKTMNHILQGRNAPIPHPISTVIIAGDLSYADAEPYRWERWLDMMEPLLRTTPLQAAPGNHEIECDNITNDIFVPYESFFRNPNRIAPPDMVPIDDDYRKTLWSCNGPSEFLGHYNYGNAFYAFTHGLAHIVVLNSYTDTKVGSIQYEWLEKELPAIDRTVTPWLLVVFHCPLHTTFLGHNHEINSRNMLENMEPLFVKYHVNIIVSGHDHAYMRTHSMIGNKLDVSGKGPVYFTLGAGGNREEHSRGYIHETPEPWVAKRDNDEYGFGNLFIANHTHAHFSWVRDGTTTKGVQDDVWLKNQLLLPESTTA